MINLIHLQQNWLNHIMPDQTKVGMVQPMFHISLAPGEKVVEYHHLVSLGHESIGQVGTDKACSAGNENFLAECIGKTDGLDDFGCVGCWDGLGGEELLILDDLSEARSFCLLVVVVADAAVGGCCWAFG